MTRNVRIRKVQMCTEAGCHFTARNRETLQKHYAEVHDLKQQMKATLTMKGWDYKIE